MSGSVLYCTHSNLERVFVPQMDAILVAENVTFQGILSYPKIEVPRGVPTFLQGESGSGKSTLLRLFNATLSPDSGNLYYNGTSLLSLEPVALRREVLLVSQSVYLFDGTILENFERFYGYRELLPPNPLEVQRFLSLTAAELPITSDCTTLSGGERQRVYLAIFLSLCPRVLLLDEPTSALDAETANRALAGITSFCKSQGITLLAVTHQEALCERYAQNLIRLSKGGTA